MVLVIDLLCIFIHWPFEFEEEIYGQLRIGGKKYLSAQGCRVKKINNIIKLYMFWDK